MHMHMHMHMHMYLHCIIYERIQHYLSCNLAMVKNNVCIVQVVLRFYVLFMILAIAT